MKYNIHNLVINIFSEDMILRFKDQVTRISSPTFVPNPDVFMILM